MEIVSNLGWARRGPETGTSVPTANVALEWFGLHARLNAAYCARRALLADLARTGAHLGSFDGGAAAALAPPPPGTRVINPNALGDGKSREGKEFEVADRNERVTRECCND
jgi:hypothetical protein